MADRQGYSSSSEADRMVIDLDFPSEGDTGNDETAAVMASETDGNSQCSLTKRVTSLSSGSQHPGELLPAEDMDLLDDIFHRSERSEIEENMSTNSNCDNADVTADESNPFGVQETDNGNEDSDSECRLIIEEKLEEEGQGATVKEGKEEGSEKKCVCQTVTCSPEQHDIMEDDMRGEKESASQREGKSPEDRVQSGSSETFSDNLGPQGSVQHIKNQEAVSQRETSSPKHRIQFELSETFSDNFSPRDGSQYVEMEQEAVLQKETSSPEQGTEFEMSETFLDNLNPQDQSQAFEGEQESVSQRVTSPCKPSMQFEMSETFLDNLNPQDDSQDLEDEEDEREDSDEHITLEKVTEGTGGKTATASEIQIGAPEFSDQFEQSETFLDNLNPQDDSQAFEDEEMKKKGCEQVVKDINRQGSQELQDEEVKERNSEQVVTDTSEQDSQHLQMIKEKDSGQTAKDRQDSQGPEDNMKEEVNVRDMKDISRHDCQDSDEKVKGKDIEPEAPSSHKQGDKEHASHPAPQNNSLSETSLPTELGPCAEGSASPNAQQHASANDVLSADCEQRPETYSFSIHEDTSSNKTIYPSVESNITEKACFLHVQLTASKDQACSLQDVSQNVEQAQRTDNSRTFPNKTCDPTPCPQGKKNVAGDKPQHANNPSESWEQVIIPKEIPSPSAVQDATVDECSSPAEEQTASEESSPVIQWGTSPPGGNSDRLVSTPDVRDYFSASRISSEKTESDGEKSLHRPEEEKPAPEMTDEDSPINDEAREEGEYSSSPSPSSEPDYDQEDSTSDVLQLSEDDLDKDADNKKTENSRGGVKDDYLTEKPTNTDPVQSSPKDNSANNDNSSSAPMIEVVSDNVTDSTKSQLMLVKQKSEKGEKYSIVSDEDGNDIIETGVDLDDKGNKAPRTASLDSSSKNSPVLAVTCAIQSSNVEKEKDDGEEDSKTLQADDSDDDVQIIECPPEEPIDTLIVDDDDDDDDDIVPNNVVISKAPVFEFSKTSKKNRTVEQDGHDLRIVVRDERREKDDSDRRHRRHDRDRRDERRSDSHRRSESDRKSSDGSSRRRHHRSRSRSGERRRKRSRSRSHSRERTSRRRRHRDRSREKSADRERSSHRKRRRDRSHERRHRSRSRSRSLKRSREDSWDKENRDDRDSSKRRQHHHDENKHRKSQEGEGSRPKHKDSPPAQKINHKQTPTWKPSDTFQKDLSDSPSSVHSEAEKSVDESDRSVEEVVQSDVLPDKKERVADEKETEVVTTEVSDIGIPKLQDIPVPNPEDIPIPETEKIPMPGPPDLPVPLPESVPELAPVPFVLQPPHLFFENPPLPPVPEEEPMENPPEPPPLPPRWPEALPLKGEGLLPTPIRRKAALEEAAAVYDPAHPTDDDSERFRFPAVPNSAPPPPEMMGGPPPPPGLPGQMMSDRTFVPTPGEGGLLGPPPARVSIQPPRFGPPPPVMMNHVVPDHPPFSNGPFPNQPPGPHPPPGFQMEMGGPAGIMPLQAQFGMGPPPPGFPGQLNETFEDGSAGPPLGQFPVSVRSGVPEIAGMIPPPSLPPPDLPMMSHPPLPDMSIQDKALADVMNDHKTEGEAGSLPPSSVFRVPPPHQAKSPSRFHLPPGALVDVDQSEDSTEVMDMDMSPVDEECELQPPTAQALMGADQEKDKKPKPLAAIDLKAINNALLKLTSVATDDVPASAVELTNKEKYMKKLHLQERVVDEVKQALRPFYSHKKIDKEEYKTILRKAVPKVCHSRSGDINPQKIQQLVEGYVAKFQRQRQYTEQKVKAPKTSPPEMGKANGERAKPAR